MTLRTEISSASVSRDIHVLPQVQSGLMLDIAMGRAWSVVETSARTGDGVLRGLSWLTSNM